MADAVWLDVLPSLATFAKDLATGTTKAAADAGKKSGAAWSKDFGAAAGDGGAKSVVDELKKASVAAEKAVSAETQAIAKARAAQRDAAAKVIEMEAKLTAARQTGDSSKVEAAELRLAAARDRLDGATSKVETSEKTLSAASSGRKELVKQLADAEGNLATATEKTGTQSQKSGKLIDSLKGSFKGAGDGADGARGKLGGLLAAFAGGAAVIATFKAGLQQAFETNAGAGKLQASLGLTKEEAQSAGTIAGRLYAQGYGESVGDMTAAVGSVISSIQGMRGASEAELTKVTGLAKSFADAFGTDVSEAARNAGVLMKTGLAPDAVTAFDLMTASLQKVPEALRGEVMDATQEYSQYFAQLGYDGPTALGMLTKAAEGGQYQIDKTGDALKEFTIRSTDMSKTSGAAYKALGLDQAEMTRLILAGGDDAKGAFDQIVGGLQSMKDPAAQSQAALALFGTPLEDLGTDKIPTFLESLTGTQGGLGDVAGKAQEANDALSGTVDPLELLKRSLTTTVSEGLRPFVQPAQDIAKWAQENPGLMQGVVIVLGSLAVALGIAAIAQWAMNSAMLANPVTWVILGIGLLIAAIVLLVQNWDTVVKFLSDTFGPILVSVQTWFGDVARKAGELWDGLVKGAQGMAEGVGGFFEGLKEKAMTPIKWIADNVINPLLAGIEQVAGFFGLSLSLPRLQFATGGIVEQVGTRQTGQPSAYATGGVLPGYTPGRDVHRFFSPTGGMLDLSGGESIMRPEFTAAVGPGWVHGANAAARAGGVAGVESYLGGFAAGGILPNANGWTGLDPAFLQALQAWAAASGYSGQVTGAGGYRTYDQQAALYASYLAGTGNLAAKPGTSAHESGLALDINPWPTAAQAAMLAQFGLGQTVAGEPWHISMPGGGSGGVVGFDPIQMLKDAIGNFKLVEGAGQLGEILNAIPGKMFDWAGSWLSEKVAALMTFVTGGSGSGGGDVKALAQSMAAARGWTGAQWSALDWIVQRESSWNPNAQNPTSTAYGLFQFLNSTWSTVGASKTSDPAGQISAGLQYIAQRYGTPAAAQAFWQANGWYDQGGILPPGATMAVNGTGVDEYVLTNPQWSNISRLAASATASPPMSPEVLAEAVRRGMVSALNGAEINLTGADVLSDKVAGEILLEIGRA